MVLGLADSRILNPPQIVDRDSNTTLSVPSLTYSPSVLSIAMLKMFGYIRNTIFLLLLIIEK